MSPDLPSPSPSFSFSIHKRPGFLDEPPRSSWPRENVVTPLSRLQRLQEEERQRIMDWDRRRIQKARTSLLHERQQQRLQRELRRALDCSNLSLARDQYLQ